MISTFAEGEFWSKKYNAPLGMDKGKPMQAFSLSNFKLHKEQNSIFNKSGRKERTYAMRDDWESGSISCKS
jgi:hypothetical protein